MWNFLVLTYSEQASRNPRPFFICGAVVFAMLLGPIFLKVMLDDPYAKFRTPEHKASVEASAQRSVESRYRLYDYCTEKKLPPHYFVKTVVDGQDFVSTCSMGMKRP